MASFKKDDNKKDENAEICKADKIDDLQQSTSNVKVEVSSQETHGADGTDDQSATPHGEIDSSSEGKQGTEALNGHLTLVNSEDDETASLSVAPSQEIIRRMSSKGCLEEEYMIAADLTLYSNPLNNALHLTKSVREAKKETPTKTESHQKNKDGGKDGGKEDDTIAADMTKYDSPMAVLDTHRNDKKDSENAKK